MYLKRLKELRNYEGYTQKDVSDFLKVQRATYAGWECGKDIIPLKRLYKLANHYEVNMDYMLGITDKLEKIKVKDLVDYQVVADNFKKFRKEHNLTQNQIATTLQTTQSNIHKYETGKCLITTVYAVTFAKNYNCSLDVLFNRKK